MLAILLPVTDHLVFTVVTSEYKHAFIADERPRIKMARIAPEPSHRVGMTGTMVQESEPSVPERFRDAIARPRTSQLLCHSPYTWSHRKVFPTIRLERGWTGLPLVT
jgi:hypothetical protein